MATYYIDTTGNDSTGNGSIATPWKSLRKATETVTSAGNTIHVNPGTYTETLASSLRAGVSLEGDNADTTIIKSTLTGSFSTFLELSSAQDTNGNQHISGITFDGNYVNDSTYKTWIGIWVTGRSNVEIHDCKVINWKDRGVIFKGVSATDPNADPGHHATGNKFYNNIILNSAENVGSYGAGCLNIGGQLGMEIYGNTIIQNQRPNFKNGWPIKYWDNGWLKGVKIYNNTLVKAPYQGSYPGENGDFDFCIELFNITGLQIYGNTIQGAIDLNYNYKTTYDYSVWIHDNVLNHATQNTKVEGSVILEFRTESAIIERNIFNNKTSGVSFNTRGPSNTGGYDPRVPAPTGGYSGVVDCVIQNNVFSNLYQGTGIGNRFAVGVISEGTDDPYIRNLYIYNNVMITKSGNPITTAIDLSSQPSGSCIGLYIKNNAVQGFTGSWLQGSNSHTNITTAEITNNDLYQNGNGNLPTYPAGNPSGYTYASNLSVAPQFVGASDFHLQSTSPLINAGVNVGIAYSGSAPDIGYAEYTSGGGGGNTAPTANAGPDQSITLPVSSVTMAGSGSDSDGSVVSHTWSKISGPTSYTITDPTSYTTTITGLVAGVYRFGLTVTDNSGSSALDDMTVTVSSPSAPTVNAGTDKIITLPTDSVTLGGSAAGNSGANIVSHTWTKLSGTGGTITTPTSYTSTVTGLTAGTYILQLSATDSNGSTSTDTMQITVNAATNTAPIANAGNDATITVTHTLDGSASSDPDGTISTYSWTKQSGPTGVNFATPNAATCILTGLKKGTYVFKLTVTDNGGRTNSDTKTLIIQ